MATLRSCFLTKQLLVSLVDENMNLTADAWKCVEKCSTKIANLSHRPKYSREFHWISHHVHLSTTWVVAQLFIRFNLIRARSSIFICQSFYFRFIFIVVRFVNAFLVKIAMDLYTTARMLQNCVYCWDFPIVYCCAICASMPLPL